MTARRLLWLGHVIPHPPKGGVLQRSHHLLRAAADGFDVDLVTFRQRAFHPNRASVSASTRELASVCRTRDVIDLPSDRSPLARLWLLTSSAVTPWPYTVRWNKSREMRRTLADLSRSEKYDLVHFDTVGMFQYRKFFPDAAWLLNHHNVESHMVRRRASRSRGVTARYLLWEAKRLASFERNQASEAHVHIVVSDLDAFRLCEAIPGAEVAVVDNPVDTSYFAPDTGAATKAGSVVFVGRIDAYANSDAVRWMRREIWPRLRRKGVARALAIVGRNPPPDVRAWAEADPSVTVTGFVEDVRPWMASASVYLCPITDGGGTRLKLLDAMAMGLPIVSHGMAIEGLDVEPGRHLLVANDAEGLAACVERVLSEPDLAVSLGRAARELAVTRYSTKAVSGRLHEAYQRCLARAEVNRPVRASRLKALR